MEAERDSWWDVLRGRKKRSKRALDDYDERTLFFWLFVSFLYLVVIILQVWGDDSYGSWLVYFDWGMSAVFLVDYLIRITIAPNRWRFFAKVWNLADLVVIATPAIAIFTGRSGAGVLRLVRIGRLCWIAWRVWDSGKLRFKRGQFKWVGVMAGAIVLLATLAVWAQESLHPDSAIHTPFDAIWWALVTMFTVGYGDTYPHTVVGRVFAVILMLTGIALFGWLTGALASLFVESANEIDAKDQRDRMQKQLDHIAGGLQRMDETNQRDRMQQQLDQMAGQLERMELALATLGKDGSDGDGSGNPLSSLDDRQSAAAPLTSDEDGG